jgi:hypothetical protein
MRYSQKLTTHEPGDPRLIQNGGFERPADLP